MERKIDELGRVVIPMEMRRSIGINPGDELKIEQEGRKIVIQKKERVKALAKEIETLTPQEQEFLRKVLS